MKLQLLSFLSLFIPASALAQAHAWEANPVESKIGIHVIPNFGDDPTVYLPIISEEAVRSALRSVDWVNGFHQVVVVLSPGTSMEVGGSLEPDHGLAAVYRNRHEQTEAVTKYAPEAVDDLEAILIAFLNLGDGWTRVQEFEFWHGRR